MKQVNIVRYNDNVVFIENGYQKHYLYFDNCDMINGIVYFCLVMLDDIELTMNCDIQFWGEWLDFYCSTNDIVKNIKFSGDTTPILADKLDAFSGKSRVPNLMYTGGKDSTLSRYFIQDSNLMVFRAQHYKVSADIPFGAETFSTNVDNELYHYAKRLRGKLQLELFFPIINKYSDTRMGIEKEVWDDPNGLLLYDLVEYQRLLNDYGLLFDSPIKHLYSPEILLMLRKYDMSFDKCGGEDFCYKDERCLGLFIMGCNLEEHGFDRDKYLLRYYKLAYHQDIHTTIDIIVKGKTSRGYFHRLAEKFYKGIGI